MFELEMERLLAVLEEEKISIGEYALRVETEESGITRREVLARMKKSLDIMRESTQRAQEEPIQSVSGLTGGDAYRYSSYIHNGKSILGDVLSEGVAKALSCSEMNASMSRIVACPTGGSCGIVPAVLLSVSEHFNKSEEETLMALFSAGGIGILIGSKATVSGAEGGCQAECGSAAAMAAGAVVELLGGKPEQAFHAAAMALKNVLGLVCDPVAGLVEIPCIKRNASGVANAMLCADLALSGVKSRIPFDEVIGAMFAVGKALPSALRETALGGLAATPTGKRLQKAVAKASEE